MDAIEWKSVGFNIELSFLASMAPTEQLDILIGDLCQSMMNAQQQPLFLKEVHLTKEIITAFSTSWTEETKKKAHYAFADTPPPAPSLEAVLNRIIPAMEGHVYESAKQITKDTLVSQFYETTEKIKVTIMGLL